MVLIISYLFIFKASALWANAFYKLICPSVCLCVCVSVCLFTFEVPFKRLFALTSQSWMSNIFRDSESLGKSYRKKWSQIWTFLLESCLKSSRKRKFFFADFALQNMVETTLHDGLETSGRRAYRKFWHISGIRFWGIPCPTKHGGNHASRWIRDLWSKGVLLI